MHISSYLPESETELAGFRISITVVSVVFDDFITGRRKLLDTIAENTNMKQITVQHS